MRRFTLLLALPMALALSCSVPVAQKEDALKTVRKAKCHRAKNPIGVNGILNELAWDDAEEIKDFVVFWEKRKAATATTARLLWDNRYLYFAAEMEDEDLFALVKDRNGMTWEDDVFELFFKPKETEKTYYEFQISALNTHLELALPSRGAGGYRRFHKEPELGLESAVKLRGTLNKHDDKDKGWTAEGRIPWTAFKASGGRPAPGDKWKFALCRYDYSAYLEQPDLSSTAPLTQRDFHRYEDYGELEFVGGKE